MSSNTKFLPDEVIRRISARLGGVKFIEDQKFGADEFDSPAYRNASYFDGGA